MNPAGTLHAAPALTVETVPIAALRDEWDGLAQRARTRHVFVSWTFLSTWWDHFRRAREPRIYAVREAGRLVAVVPFYLETVSTLAGRVRVLRNVGYGDVVNPDFLDVICEAGAEERVAAALAPHLAADRSWDFAEFNEIDPHGSLPRIAAGWERRGVGRARLDVRSVCPFVPLPDTFERFLADRNPHFRQQLRRYRRKIERELGVEWKRVGRDVDVATGIDLLARLHQERMESSGRGGNFRKDDYLEFHRALAAQLAPTGELYFWVLYIEGLPGASHYGFLSHGTYYGYQMGFTPHYARWSLGHYMTGVVLEKLIEEEHAHEMNLLRGRDAWKFRWTDATRTTGTLWFERPGLGSAWARTRAALSVSPALALRFIVGRDNFEELRTAIARWRGAGDEEAG